ncbi:MAG TPA: hypothetical protein DD379_11085 [Cyanobacteria bacterium UBA11162]|nr:hypothetical protein [Cyanobacteria bacterium UBA11162]
MVWTKLPQYLVILSTPLFLELVIIPGFLTTAHAQSETLTQTTANLSLQKVTFEPRPDQPRPTITVGGGRRNDGKCSEDRNTSQPPTSDRQSLDQHLTPILPSSGSDVHLTVVTHPTFLVYVPETSAKAVEFILEDPDGVELYRIGMNLKNTPSIVSIGLPATAPELEIGKDYKWIVAMVCQSPSPEDPFAEGLVRRIQPDSALSRLENAKHLEPLEQVAVYAKLGIWYEASAKLAALQNTQPNNPAVVLAWEQLLQDVGLGAIADVPVKN